MSDSTPDEKETKSTESADTKPQPTEAKVDDKSKSTESADTKPQPTEAKVDDKSKSAESINTKPQPTEAKVDDKSKSAESINTKPQPTEAKVDDKSKSTESADTKSESTDIVAQEPPKPKEYTPEEIAEIAKRVTTPSDQTPPYTPTNILTPEFEGTSNYERGLDLILEQTRQKLASSPDSDSIESQRVKEDLKMIENLYQNFHNGMNVFRTAKGGRDKLRA